MSAPKEIFQSASRDDTFNECSQLYAAKYLLKLPDPGNEGSSRGSVCHDALELLAKPKHRHFYDAAIKHQTCTEVPALWRLLRLYARKYKVCDEVNLRLIDGFMLVALNSEFYGPPGVVEDIAELPFEIRVDEPDGRRYNVKGFIDRIFRVGEGESKSLTARDFKSAKSKFSGDKLDFNVQQIIYSLALRRLFPRDRDFRFDFLFLKFPKDPWVTPPPVTEAQLLGYEWILTDMQRRLESFTLANASDNLASANQELMWKCGKEGAKKDGTPNWICPMRRPRDYWSILDKNGQAVESADSEAALMPKLKAGQRVEKRRYSGCVAWYNKDGKPRNFA